MAYYADLSDYSYLASAIRHPATKNVGWLAPGHAFATAEPSEELVERLWRYCKISVAQTRGVHACELCSTDSSYRGERGGETLLLGTAEIRVFSGADAVYAAPTLIYHYVSVHHYAPPEQFLGALADEPAPPDQAYFARLQQLGLAWNATSTSVGPPRKLWV